MTPCEKLGYKVGDQFEVVKNEGFHNFEIGRKVLLINDDGTEEPRFEGVGPLDKQWVPLNDVKPINDVLASTPSILKNPIEYLKSAHADGDMICPATMLRECYGITKTERVITEWSDVKRDIKVGDRVKIVGPASYTDQSSLLGEIRKVGRIDWHSTEARYDIECYDDGRSYWFPETSVELV